MFNPVLLIAIPCTVGDMGDPSVKMYSEEPPLPLHIPRAGHGIARVTVATLPYSELMKLTKLTRVLRLKGKH